MKTLSNLFQEQIKFRDTTLQTLMVNIVDTLLLVDLNLLAFLTLYFIHQIVYIHKETLPISYILVVLSVIYITIGTVSLCIYTIW